MSLDAYKERQDRTFDTFRSRFNHQGLEKVVTTTARRSDSSSSRSKHGRTSSTCTFGELSNQMLDMEEADSPIATTPQLSFTPQIRKLEHAPWEDSKGRVDEMSKPKKSRSSILKKLRKVTSGGKSNQVTHQVPFVDSQVPDDDTTSTSPRALSDASSKLHDTIFIEQVLATTPTARSGRRSDVPLGKPIDLAAVRSVHTTIAFGPVDPNILHLRQPVTVIPEDDEYRSLKPSASTPQIHYESEQSTDRKDRMSRMFDGLQFD